MVREEFSLLIGSRKLPALFAAALFALSTLAHADSLTVKTAQGKVHGKTINNGKVNAWLGLPYAAPPVGELRWKAPEPAAKWAGERDATNYGAHCEQSTVYDDQSFQDNGPREDCLFLNVYAPAEAKAKAKLPVMFWIHGGGYSGGGSNEPRHNGDFLPVKGVVLVTINYRLGVFGFLATSSLAKEQGGAAGNYGLMDMVAALTWVKANIARFGGDSGNVTIFGESAGSTAVSTLMAAPSARGLFQKAIGESGAPFSASGITSNTLAGKLAKGDEWAASVNARSLAELRALPAETILASLKSGERHFSFGQIVDGKFLTEPVAETYAAGRQAHVPLLAGWNADEDPSLLEKIHSAAEWKEFAAKTYGDKADELLKHYPAGTDEQALRSAIDWGSDKFIAYDTWAWLEAHRKTGDAPVYRYHLELAATPSEFESGTFAFHSDDIEYVFGTLDTRAGWEVRPEDRKLSDQIMSYWTNFAKKGNPNGEGLPEWPRYNDAGYPLIHLDSTVTNGPDKLRGRYEFLKANPPPER